MPPYSASFFADGPGDNILISYVGRRPERNALLTTVQTFELSFDLTPHDSAPADAWRSIVHFGQSHTYLPAFYLYPGSTRLEVCMERQGGHICCNPEETLPVGEVTHVGVRLVGETFTVSFNGQQKCITGGFYQNRIPAQPSVDVWFSDPWYPAADVTVANLVYTSLYSCGPVG